MTSKDPRTNPRSTNAWQDIAPRGRPTLLDWLRAWREVVRDPDKQIPSLPMPPEGLPIPEGLDLHCPGCDYNLTGLREWRCPECGERFSPHRAYTRRLMRSPEFFLRYRYSPRELRSVLWSLLMFLGGSLPLLWADRTFAIVIGLFVLGFFVVIALPNMLLLRWQAGLSWPRFFFWTSLLFFLAVMAVMGLPWL
jgi:hypothetical protein